MVPCSVLAEHLHILLQEDSHPSPIVATSFTSSVVVNKQQAPLVLRCYCCKALGIQSTDDAQTLPTSAGAVKLLESELKLTVQPLQIIAHGCISPSFVSFTSTASLPRFSLLFLLYAQPVYPMTEGRVSSAAPLCIRGSAGSARGRKAVSELWSCAVVVVAVSSRRDPAGFSEATLHI